MNYPLAIAILFVALGPGLASNARTIHTPKPGSSKRQAIFDAARAYVLSKYATGTLPQPIVFKINHLAVAGVYANMEAIPLFKDGSYVDPNYLPDIAFNFCVKNTGSSWHVIADLSRSDVPTAAEAAELKRMLPSDFPRALLSSTWRDLLRG